LDPFPGFAEFVQARGAALTRTAYLLTGSAAAAEDLVQDALVSAATRWRRLTASGDPEAYIRRAMVNSHVGRWRKTGRRESPVNEPPDRLQPDPTERTAGRIDVMRALAQLAPRQRAVIVLRFYEDLTEAETAGILGCAIGTVKSQTADALRKLRTLGAVRTDTKAEIG
jgi:RNA polymerase sigma-70 factor (sigma-E family)